MTFKEVGTISDPSGTYDTHIFFEQLIDSSTCDCLSKETCSYVGPAPLFSNKDVEGPYVATFKAEPSAALVTIGCLPPSEVQYFAYQTNIFATHMNENEVYFPEVSPIPSINQLTMGTSPGTPYIIIITGDADIADTITQTLLSTGAMDESIHLDGISHPSISVGGETPDVLEIVARPNNKDFSPELFSYIEASPTEQLALYLDPIKPPSEVNLLPAFPLRQRSAKPNPSAPDYAQELDDLTRLIEKELIDLGFVMSYSGEMRESIDFGYNDTELTRAVSTDIFRATRTGTQ